jgi:hypothetical protein
LSKNHFGLIVGFYFYSNLFTFMERSLVGFEKNSIKVKVMRILSKNHFDLIAGFYFYSNLFTFMEIVPLYPAVEGLL